MDEGAESARITMAKKNLKRARTHKQAQHKSSQTAQMTQAMLDQTEETSVPVRKPTIPTVRSPVLHFLSSGASISSRRALFYPAEYDLTEIGRVEDVEAYVRQAFKKKASLMFKEGFEYTGKNPRIVGYLQARFAQIERASGISHEDLLRRVGGYLIKRSNAFLIKVRNTEASGGRERELNGRSVQPIAAYFPAAPETMYAAVDDTGRILRWKQRMPNGIEKEFHPDDVVHFVYDRKEGFLFGTPEIVPVLDDIRALRKIEENVELLVYKHLFPLFHYKVGTETAPAGHTEKGEDEIDVIKAEIENMPSEGGIVTPERHEIKAIGAESRALRVEGYLEHFKKRVFAGLGMSGIDFGEADTANRSTSDTLSLALIDSVKDLQETLESQWNMLVVGELLQESTFGEEIFEPDNLVKLNFKEIDIDKQIKVENHLADIFSKHGITWDELRVGTGRKTIDVPDDPDGGTPEEFPEWYKTWFKLFEEPSLLIRAVDEPYGTPAMAAAEARSTSLTAKTVATAEQASKKQVVAEAKAKRAAAPPARRDNFLLPKLNDLENDFVREGLSSTMDTKMMRALAESSAVLMTNDLLSRANAAFLSALGSLNLNNPHIFRETQLARRELERRAQGWAKRFTADLTRQVEKGLASAEIDTNRPGGKVSVIRSVFDSLRYRTDFVTDVEVRKAYNWGLVVYSKLAGASILHHRTDGAGCEKCATISKARLRIEAVDIEDIAPHHAACHCWLDFEYQRNDTVAETAEDKPGPHIPEKNYRPCPKCGRTALKKKDVPGVYVCKRCDEAFTVQEDDTESTDQEKLERCVLRVKQQLKRKSPGTPDAKIKSKAFAICNASLKKGS